MRFKKKKEKEAKPNKTKKSACSKSWHAQKKSVIALWLVLIASVSFWGV